MIETIFLTMKFLWNRLQLLREDDRGMTTEAIVVTALLIGLALFAVGAIAAAVRNRASNVADRINQAPSDGGG
jgi:hypothetical protein